jgi:hypothetical protein
MGESSQSHSPAALSLVRDLIPIVQELRWTPGVDRTGVENLSATGIRSSDGPGRSESRYRLIGKCWERGTAD